MAFYDLLPFLVVDGSGTFAPGGASVVTQGVRPSKQTGNMALIVTFDGGPYDGTYDVIVETAAEEDGGANPWIATGDRINGIAVADIYRLVLANPILDKVRLRINATGTPGLATITPRYLSNLDGMVPLP